VLHRDVQSLDDISGGRVLLGVGTGGDLDAGILGGAELTTRERVDRFQEFVELLVRLRTEDHVDADGRWFSARNARTLPPLRDVPLVVAANGPRSLRFAARTGDAWVTTGPKVETVEEWWKALDSARRTLEEALVAAERDPATFPRYLNLDSSPQFSLTSRGVFDEMVGRAESLGFTDVIAHWPRPDGPYAGSVEVLEDVAANVVARVG
jgi:alkanesulfonate monooxygenase SsuD/methylene tetrahydromethanopterin reductase-like flavin-dependent oxidoreductase (luciferase family)